MSASSVLRGAGAPTLSVQHGIHCVLKDRVRLGADDLDYLPVRADNEESGRPRDAKFLSVVEVCRDHIEVLAAIEGRAELRHVQAEALRKTEEMGLVRPAAIYAALIRIEEVIELPELSLLTSRVRSLGGICRVDAVIFEVSPDKIRFARVHEILQNLRFLRPEPIVAGWTLKVSELEDRDGSISRPEEGVTREYGQVGEPRVRRAAGST